MTGDEAAGEKAFLKSARATQQAGTGIARYLPGLPEKARNWQTVKDPESGKMARVGNQKIVAATFRHDTSRNLDPQLHTHAVLANMVRGAHGKWRSMANEGLYRIGRNFRPDGKGSYIGTRPNKASIRSICRKISEMTARRHSWRSAEGVVKRLSQTITGWGNCFCLGHVSPAYRAVDEHATKRLHQWLCRKHGTKTGKVVLFPDTRLGIMYGLTYLAPTTKGLSWGEGMISSESRMRENRTSDLMSGGEETWLWPRPRHRHRAKAAGKQRLARAYGSAPPLDSTHGAGRYSHRFVPDCFVNLRDVVIRDIHDDIKKKTTFRYLRLRRVFHRRDHRRHGARHRPMGTLAMDSQRWGMATIYGFFVVGLILLLPLKDPD